MSSFNFPENVMEPTNSFHPGRHSTQFSFDESIIHPTLLLSPSLSSKHSGHAIKTKKNFVDDVVDVVSCMKRGCFMIVCDHVNDSNTHGNNNNIDSEHYDWKWKYCHLSSDQRDIVISSNSSNTSTIKLSKIERVSKLHRDSANRVQSALNMQGIEQIGLQSVTLRLTMKNASKTQEMFLIFDEYRNAFIWNRGLRTLSELCHTLSGPIQTAIAIVCSSVDRINNHEMHQKMLIRPRKEESYQWIKHIETKMHLNTKLIDRLYSFAANSCILDSTEHVSLLMQCMSLKNMLSDITDLLAMSMDQLNSDQMISLRELWLSLSADITVAILKENQMKNDMKLSRQK